MLKKNSNTLIITNPTNIYYLIGFKGLSPEEREAIVILKNKKPTIILPRLYQEEAKQLKGVTVKIVYERNKLFATVIELLKNITTPIGFEANNLTYAEYQELKTGIKNLQPLADQIEQQRVIKTDNEIKAIKKAVQITDQAFVEIIKFLKPGLTELQVSKKLIEVMESFGSTGLAFEPIIAAGKNSALPHHATSNKVIKSGEPVLFDFGAKYKGYCADLTRVVFLGTAPDEFIRCYQQVLKAEELAISKTLAGVSCQQLQQTVLDFFGQDAKYYTHGLGHGVGLDIHERPYLKIGVEEILAENMIITIEPGLYFPNKFGIRIEDYLIVDKNSSTVLSKAPKNLIEL